MRFLVGGITTFTTVTPDILVLYQSKTYLKLSGKLGFTKFASRSCLIHMMCVTPFSRRKFS